MHEQGQRQKKLEAKKVREEIEEEERKQTDIEEAKFQEQKRKEAIEKAKTLQYYQNDRVKRFHVSILIFFCCISCHAHLHMYCMQRNGLDFLHILLIHLMIYSLLKLISLPECPADD